MASSNGRARVRRANKKARRADELWGENREKLESVCVVCNQKFTLDGVKAERQRDYKFMVGAQSFKVCLGCSGRNPRRVANMVYLLTRISKLKCPDRAEPTHKKKCCNSLQCTARRVVKNG